MTTQDPVPDEPFSPAEFAARMLNDLAARLRAGEIQPWSTADYSSLKYGQTILERDLNPEGPADLPTQPEHLQALVMTFIDSTRIGQDAETTFSRFRPNRVAFPDGFDKDSGRGGPFEPDANTRAIVRLRRLVDELRAHKKSTLRGYYDAATPRQAAQLAALLEREYHDLPDLKLFVLPYLDNDDLLHLPPEEQAAAREVATTRETMQRMGERLAQERQGNDDLRIEVRTLSNPDRLFFFGYHGRPVEHGVGFITFDAVARHGESEARELLEDFCRRMLRGEGEQLLRSLEPPVVIGRTLNHWELPVTLTSRETPGNLN